MWSPSPTVPASGPGGFAGPVRKLGFFERLSVGWKLTKVSLSILRKEKGLIVLPFLSLLTTGITWLVFFLGLFLFLPNPTNPFGSVVFYVGLAVVYFITFFVSIYFNAAVMGAAMIRLNGGDPTISDGLRVANTNLRRIAGWALLSATVGLVLRAVRLDRPHHCRRGGHRVEHRHIPGRPRPDLREARTVGRGEAERDPASPDVGRSCRRLPQPRRDLRPARVARPLVAPRRRGPRRPDVIPRRTRDRRHLLAHPRVARRRGPEHPGNRPLSVRDHRQVGIWIPRTPPRGPSHESTLNKVNATDKSLSASWPSIRFLRSADPWHEPYGAARSRSASSTSR